MAAPSDLVGLCAETVAQCGTVTLRAADPDGLAALVAAGLFPAGEQPTVSEWYDPVDLPASAASTVTYHRELAAAASPERWTLAFGVHLDGVLVGCQTARGEGFAETGDVVTGSWLAPSARGRGVGRAARAAVLAAAFDELGARTATSYALQRNVASQTVTRRLGYQFAGMRLCVLRGELELLEKFTLTAQQWADTERPVVRTEGFGAWRTRVGITEPASVS